MIAKKIFYIFFFTYFYLHIFNFLHILLISPILIDVSFVLKKMSNFQDQKKFT